MKKMDYRRALSHSVVSGGKLEVPRTAAQRVLLSARLIRLKRDFLKRQEQS